MAEKIRENFDVAFENMRKMNWINDEVVAARGTENCLEQNHCRLYLSKITSHLKIISEKIQMNS